jgi:hypothetical protein
MGAKDISPEVVERMAKLIRDMDRLLSAAPDQSTIMLSPAYHEAAEIARLLPVPVDPDEVEVREIVGKYLQLGEYGTDAMFLELLKRGRQLSQDQPS